MRKSISFKKTLCILLSCLFLFASFAAISVSAAETPTANATSLGTNTITLDGIIDDAWADAPSFNLSLKDGTSNDSVTIKALYNDDSLYVLADIKDNTSHVSNEKWWNNDAIEFLIVTAGSDPGSSLVRRMHLQRNGVVSGGYFSGDVDEKDVFWGIWKTPKYKDNGADGWIVEYAIPLNNSEVWGGDYKNVTKYVTFDCVYYSADSSSTNRTGLLGWCDNGVVDSGKVTVDNLGRINLFEEKTYTTKITGASISIGSDIAMNYYVNITDDELKADLSKLSMKFTMNGETETVTEYSTVNGEYVFAFEGIAPQNMGDAIKAELLYNDAVINVKDGYSIKDNAAELLGEYANDAKIVRVVTDLLNYGAAAQTYANYKTDALVNANVAGMATASTAAPSENDKLVLTGNETDGVKIDSESLVFDGVNKISFKLNISAEKASTAKIKLDGTDVVLADLENLGNGSYNLVTDAIKITDFDKTFTLVLMDGEVEVSKLQYSVNSYAFSMKDDAQQGGFALALYYLGVSANAYNAK